MITENTRLENEYILKAYLLYILLATWGLSYILIDLVNQFLTYRANIDNQYHFTRLVELIGPIQLIFVAIAAVLSFIVFSVYHKINVMMLKSKISDKLGLSKRLNRQVSWSTSFKFPLIIIKIAFFIIKWFSKITLLFFGLIISALGDSVSPSTKSSSPSSIRFTVDQFGKEKESAEREARQKQKDADYAFKHAGKQARFNPNTIHMDNRLNRANAKQHEANKAAKKARNM